MKYLITFFLILIFNTLGYSQSDTLKTDSYTIIIPEGWKIKEGCLPGDCSLLAPHDNFEDTFLENINIVVAKAPAKNYPVKKYADFSVGYLPSVIENFEVIDRKPIANNGEYVIYQGIKSDFKQTWKQYYFIKNEGLYIITFTAETDRFDEYINKIQANLDSFQIK